MTLRLLSGLTATDVDAAIAQAVEDHTPGISLGSATLTTSFTTTNNNAITAVTGLSVVVVGQGRPVEVKIYVPSVIHTTANQILRVDLRANGTAIQSGWVTPPLTTTGPTLTVAEEMTLTDGESYTFTAAVFFTLAGTMTLFAQASPVRRIRLSVISR
jgi:hypothetical protein